MQGLSLEGAVWDQEAGVLKRPDNRSLVTGQQLPIMQLLPIEASKLKPAGLFAAPVYVSRSRRNAMGEGLIFEADLATKEHSSHWTLQGVALTLNAD